MEYMLVTEDIEKHLENTVSPQKLSKKKLDLYKYSDVGRVLRQATGVYVRDEEGLGLRPNIGMRGTNPDRSKKVVFLEDDILSGPAPYSAPAAYYVPSMAHIESVDVYKGFSAVPYGPNSIGGAVNYVGLSLPQTNYLKGEASTGAFNSSQFKLNYGNKINSFSYLFYGARTFSDGFKKIDGGGFAGFLKNDLGIKAKFEIPNFEKNNLEFNLGYENENSNETYLGLSLNDISSSPYRRYASSKLDKMSWDHFKINLKNSVDLTDNVTLESAIYRNDFKRIWNRLDGFVGANVSLADILNSPNNYENYYKILKGEDDSSSVLGDGGRLILASNDRKFFSQGVQTKLDIKNEEEVYKNNLQLSLRFHQDQIIRNHDAKHTLMQAGALIEDPVQVIKTDLNKNNASALTLSAVDNLSISRFVVTALSRFEKVDFNFSDSLSGKNINRTNYVFAPGIGILFKWNNSLSTKLSVNRGVSVAGLNDDGSEVQEKSINYELGVKYVSSNLSEQAEIVAFANDYQNISGTCTGSTGCNSRQLDAQFNGGAALVSGLEMRLAKNIEIGKASFPIQFNLTYLDPQFKNDFYSRSPEWGVGQILSGAELPYVPQWQYNLMLGMNYGHFRQELSFIYQGASYDSSLRDSRFLIPGYGIVDWTAKYNLSEGSQIFARVDNLLAKDYIVSLRPFGARPGKPQSFMVGLSYTF